MSRKATTSIALIAFAAFSGVATAQTTQGSIENPLVKPGNAGSELQLQLNVFNPGTGESLVKYIGLTNAEMQPSQVTPTYLKLDFGNVDLGQFASGTFSGTRYSIVSRGDADLNLLTTGADAALGAMDGDQLLTALSNLGTWQDLFYVGSVTNPVFSNNATDALNWNRASAGLGASLGSGINSAAALGSALAFYKVTRTDPDDGTVPTTQVRFQNALSQVGHFLLTLSSGTLYNLTYEIGTPSVVPLPAAVWLLLSGLASFGVVSRRRVAA